MDADSEEVVVTMADPQPGIFDVTEYTAKSKRWRCMNQASAHAASAQSDEIQLPPVEDFPLPASPKDQINEQSANVESQEEQFTDSIVTDVVADADAAGGPPQKRLRKKANLEKHPTTSNNVGDKPQ